MLIRKLRSLCVTHEGKQISFEINGRHVLRISEKRLINQPHCIVLVTDTTKEDRYLRQLDWRQGILPEAILYKFNQRTILIEVAQAPSDIHGN
ncbi:hypothetical protein XFF6990_130216 [Xanthomonas citri pv. fuscans]|uniref:Uncharacterized protein n=1 Tax=Xanthomonas campestris pv. phaseoli TaxID=317013 RepID=A0A7Z7NHA5_XANCH|nr:hypothetical protein XFF6990_130216 [Xanthomonas citri pv. fuscans]SOO24601.1 hypothetical protein XFF6991_390049 [Xanthomonas phaseoli pv. phaseoli]